MELRKLYYLDEAKQKEVYKERFNAENSVKLNFYIGKNQAFFVCNEEVYRLAYSIADLDKKILKLSKTLPGVALGQYTDKCLIDEIMITNKIEGVHSTRKEIDDTLNILATQSDQKGKKLRFLSLVRKYAKLMKKEVIPLNTCEDIRSLYDELFLKEVVDENPANAPDGKLFRKELASVHSVTDKVIHKGVHPEEKIIESMENALSFLNDGQADLLFRICIFHYLFEYIHPFYDGNGRLGRFILSYCLSKRLEPITAFCISKTIKNGISAYYKGFTVCNDPHNLGDLTPFLIMMLQMIATSMIELLEALHGKYERWTKYSRMILTLKIADSKEQYNFYNYLLQAALFSESGISYKQLEKVMRTSYYMVLKSLKEIPKELLVVNTKGSAKFFSLNLDTIDEMIANSK